MDSDNNFHAGIFETISVIMGQETTTDQECDSDKAGAADCAAGQDMKCKSQKAFIILGILANAAALGLVVSGVGPAIAATAAGGFAATSYLITWALFASTMNASVADCGYDGIKFGDEEVGYGAGFALAIVAWILCILGSVAAMLAANSA